MERIVAQFKQHIHSLQNSICAVLEKIDAKEVFVEDTWQRDGGGGGWSRVLENGRIFEKAGVNVSAVYGPVTEIMKSSLKMNGDQFLATGISLVIHPENPMVPTVHANIRMFQLLNSVGEVIDIWFGGGLDLTPYYLFEEDAIHFHSVIKNTCDRFNSSLYPRFKKDCDIYFNNTHRKESRGIGGIFFDYQRASEEMTLNEIAEFTKAVGSCFILAYIPIVEKRMNLDYSEHQKWFQEVRRGRYAEFNLIHDRGTLFGLKTNGRIESILMSLPPRVRWVYDYQPNPETEEAKLIDVLRQPKDWI
jgi:coproporphyrinogen III oxidase